MTKPGKSRKESAEIRDSHVSARLTEQEGIMLDKFAWAEGITPSSAIRWLICGCLSDEEARTRAIEAGNAWIDSERSHRLHALANCAKRFKDEACERIALECAAGGISEAEAMAKATVSRLEYAMRSSDDIVE